jgi:hypothetical protein
MQGLRSVALSHRVNSTGDRYPCSALEAAAR